MHPGRAACTLKPLGDEPASGMPHVRAEGAGTQEPDSGSILELLPCTRHLPRTMRQSPGVGDCRAGSLIGTSSDHLKGWLGCRTESPPGATLLST